MQILESLYRLVALLSSGQKRLITIALTANTQRSHNNSLMLATWNAIIKHNPQTDEELMSVMKGKHTDKTVKIYRRLLFELILKHLVSTSEQPRDLLRNLVAEIDILWKFELYDSIPGYITAASELATKLQDHNTLRDLIYQTEYLALIDDSDVFQHTDPEVISALEQEFFHSQQNTEAEHLYLQSLRAIADADTTLANSILSNPLSVDPNFITHLPAKVMAYRAGLNAHLVKKEFNLMPTGLRNLIITIDIPAIDQYPYLRLLLPDLIYKYGYISYFNGEIDRYKEALEWLQSKRKQPHNQVQYLISCYKLQLEFLIDEKSGSGFEELLHEFLAELKSLNSSFIGPPVALYAPIVIYYYRNKIWEKAIKYSYSLLKTGKHGRIVRIAFWIILLICYYESGSFNLLSGAAKDAMKDLKGKKNGPVEESMFSIFLNVKHDTTKEFIKEKLIHSRPFILEALKKPPYLHADLTMQLTPWLLAIG